MPIGYLSSITYLLSKHSINSYSMEPTFSAWVPQNDSVWIPDGFVIVVGPDDEKYIVPEFMVDNLDQQFNADRRTKILRAFSAPGSVSNFFFCYKKNIVVVPVLQRIRFPCSAPNNKISESCAGAGAGYFYYYISLIIPPVISNHRFLNILQKIFKDISKNFDIIGEGNLIFHPVPVSRFKHFSGSIPNLF